MKKIRFLFTAAVLLTLPALSFSQENANTNLATNYNQYQKLFANRKLTIARSKEDFAKMARTNPALREIFDKQTLSRFLSKLKMGEKGLITFSYQAIKEKFPSDFSTQLNTTLAAFGFAAVETLPGDYDGYYCEGAGTCTKQFGSICIGANCK